MRALLRLVEGGDYTCAEIRERTATHLHEIEQKLRDLNKMRRTLETMVASCHGGSVPDCPIVDELLCNEGETQEQ